MRIFFIAAALILSLIPAVIGQTQQQQDEKTALYAKYYENKKGAAEQQKVAYEAAKEYLRKFGVENDQYVQAVKKFVAAYERLMELDALLKAKDYSKGFDLGRQILNVESDNFYVLTKLTEAGLDSSNAGSTNQTAEAIAYARKALQLIDSGKLKDPSPFVDIETARNFHNIALASLLLEGSPEESAAIFLKVLKTDEYKNEPSIYYYFGRALLKGDYQKLITEFKAKYEGKPQTSEAKAMLEQINHVVERIIDTYARAVALSNRPEHLATRNEVLTQLTPIYKALHNNSDAGLEQLIANVLSKPMP